MWAGAAAAVVLIVAAVGAFVLIRGGSDDKTVKANGNTPIAESEPASAEPIPPDTVPSETPEVTAQATGLKEEPVPSMAPGQGDQQGVLPNSGGCDHAYGEPTQCIPVVFPDGITEYADKCLWLKLNGLTTVKVVGKDGQHLDPDGNKIACDG